MDVDVYAIRRMNLERLLVPLHGKVAALAERLGNTPSQVYLTQVLSDKTQRRMGAHVARLIERKMDLPAGWFDLVDNPIANLSERATSIAHKIDHLPEDVQERIEREIDTLYRYSRKTD